MESSQSNLVLGKPRFLDADLQQLAAAEGVVAAWRKGFERHKTNAPNSVAGDFAVAVQTADDGVFMAVDRFATRTPVIGSLVAGFYLPNGLINWPIVSRKSITRPSLIIFIFTRFLRREQSSRESFVFLPAIMSCINKGSLLWRPIDPDIFRTWKSIL